MSSIPLQQRVWYRWARVYFTGSCIIGFGVLCFKYTVPTDEELIARFSPEVRADYERNKELRHKEQEELMKIVKQTSASNDPIWKTGYIKSPFEKEGRGVDPKLVNIEEFNRAKANEFKLKELEVANQELEEQQALAKQKKKHWWSWS